MISKRTIAIINKRGSFASNFPKLIKYWDNKKNNPLEPNEVTSKSSKKVWWVCEKGHPSYESRVYNFANGRRCPICKNLNHRGINNPKSKKLIKAKGPFTLRFPNLLKEWDFSKNGTLQPDDLLDGSDIKVWWNCSRNHSWQTQLKTRTLQGTNCPICKANTSNLEIRVYSELLKISDDCLWQEKIDNLEFDIFSKSLNLAIEVDGYPWHKNKQKLEDKKYTASIKNKFKLIRLRDERLKKVKGIIIPYNQKKQEIESVINLFKNIKKLTINNKFKKNLSKLINSKKFQNNKKFNEIVSFLPGPIPEKSFGKLFPKIALEWDKVKNHPLLPHQVHQHSNQKFYWKCKKNHSWLASVTKRVNGRGCPYCANRIVSKDNNLKKLFPLIAKEWNYKKNFPLTPDKIVAGSYSKVWWTCKNGHDWESQPRQRTAKGKTSMSCFRCTSLGFLSPIIARDWDYKKNYPTTPFDVRNGSNTKYYWICDKKHSWKANISSRTIRKTGCPYCKGNLASKENNLVVKFPKIIKSWDYKKNTKIKPNQLTPYTAKKVWWICEHNHSWKAAVSSRTSENTGCPKCYKNKINKFDNFIKIKKGYSLKEKNPKLSAEWCYKKNGKLKPELIGGKSNKSVWWECKKGHQWQEKVIYRNKKSKNKNYKQCPSCEKKKIVINGTTIEFKNMREAADKVGITYECLTSRIHKSKWSLKKALSMPQISKKL